MSDAADFATLVRRLTRGFARLEREQICCEDVTWQQFDTLRAIHAAGGLATGAVSEQMGIDLSTASRNLAVLERQGYLTRSRDRNNGRLVTNKLTAKGRRCVESLCCDERVVFDAVLVRIPAVKRRAVLESLVDLCAALDTTDTAVVCCTTPNVCNPKENQP